MRRSAWVGVGLVVVGLVAGLLGFLFARGGPPSSWGPGRNMSWMMRSYAKPSYASEGERIFFTGTGNRGPIPFRVAGTGPMGGMMMRTVGCANCHGPDGRGGLLFPDGVKSADIRWAALTAEDMDHPPYTPETLKRAITQGVDPAGHPLSPFMPRWDMTPEEQDAIVAFLRTLGSGR
jgi:cytochrome c oxidase subunit 2